jgi:hypothetical protein
MSVISRIYLKFSVSESFIELKPSLSCTLISSKQFVSASDMYFPLILIALVNFRSFKTFYIIVSSHSSFSKGFLSWCLTIFLATNIFQWISKLYDLSKRIRVLIFLNDYRVKLSIVFLFSSWIISILYFNHLYASFEKEISYR